MLTTGQSIHNLFEAREVLTEFTHCRFKNNK